MSNSPNSGNWAGSLKSKRKAELQQLCRELSIEYKSDALKVDLEQEIVARFDASPTLKSDARFEGLIYENSNTSSPINSVNPVVRVRRSRSISRPASQAHTQPRQENPVESSKRASPRRSDSASSQQVSREILDSAKSVEKNIHSVASQAATAVRKESAQVTQLAKRSSQRAIESFNAFGHCSSQTIACFVHGMQRALSSPWTMCILTVLAELTYVLDSLIPTRRDEYGGSKSQSYSHRLPALLKPLVHLVISRAFLRPLIHYSILTVLLPTLFAGLMNVPTSRSNTKKLSWADLKPSVFGFSSTRLAVIALMNLVFNPTYHYGWANQHLHFASTRPEFTDQTIRVSSKNTGLIGFEAIQYVGTAFTLAISLHQLITSQK